MIGPERPSILPLCVNGFVPLSNRNPPALAGGDARPLIRFLEPRHDPRRLSPVAVGRFVVVRQRTIKWILPRREPGRNEIVPMRALGIVKAAIVPRPIRVPGAGSIRDRIAAGRF